MNINLKTFLAVLNRLHSISIFQFIYFSNTTCSHRFTPKKYTKFLLLLIRDPLELCMPKSAFTASACLMRGNEHFACLWDQKPELASILHHRQSTHTYIRWRQRQPWRDALAIVADRKCLRYKVMHKRGGTKTRKLIYISSSNMQGSGENDKNL
jgi:hypothetical protein